MLPSHLFSADAEQNTGYEQDVLIWNFFAVKSFFISIFCLSVFLLSEKRKKFAFFPEKRALMKVISVF